MRFTKMEGTGNDYVYVNCFDQPIPDQPERLATKISDRHFGVGGDGLVLILPSDTADARMRMFNADGSEGEMCGNAIRCIAKYLYDHNIRRRETLVIETGAGPKTLQLFADPQTGKIGKVRVDMGKPILNPADIPVLLGETPVVDVLLTGFGKDFRVTCVSMGNPHCVTFDLPPVDENVLGLGPKIETDPRFPRRINVEFVERISPTELRMRVWERGSGETLACGTGACAVLVAGVLSGRCERKALIHLTGGDLEIEWSAENDHVYKTGAATEVFSGVYEV
ncbi:MAG: diaminopimelate epimerase [Planctomycetaceae bacterium]|nr:diaminopimelate epimerase [Planctomycetaceae bacterium]